MTDIETVQNAIRLVKPARATKAIIPQQACYLQQDGFLHAQNGWIQVRSPCLIEGTFLVNGDAFEHAISRMPGSAFRVDVAEDKIVVRGGRLRSTLRTLSPSDFPWLTPDMEPVAGDLGAFHAALQTLRPFVNDNATRFFTTCVHAMDGEAWATNNVTVVRHTNTGLPTDVSFALPTWALDYLLSREAPETMALCGTSLRVAWPDGSSLLTTLGNEPWPDAARAILEKTPDPTWEIPGVWRDDMARLHEFGDQIVHVFADEALVGRGEMSTVLHAPSPVPEGEECSTWGVAHLGRVLACATHMDLTTWPRPMPFSGPDIHGVMASRRR